MTAGPILFCYDGSSGSRRAIDAAAQLLTGREAVVLDVGPLELLAETYAAAGSGAADISQAVARGTQARAEEGAELARRAGFQATARGEVDAPTWRSIVDVANEIDAAVIVLGSRGLTGWRELVDGSVSHEVAEHAAQPILIVPPPD